MTGTTLSWGLKEGHWKKVTDLMDSKKAWKASANVGPVGGSYETSSERSAASTSAFVVGPQELGKVYKRASCEDSKIKMTSIGGHILKRNTSVITNKGCIIHEVLSQDGTPNGEVTIVAVADKPKPIVDVLQGWTAKTDLMNYIPMSGQFICLDPDLKLDECFLYTNAPTIDQLNKNLLWTFDQMK